MSSMKSLLSQTEIVIFQDIEERRMILINFNLYILYFYMNNRIRQSLHILLALFCHQ